MRRIDTQGQVYNNNSKHDALCTWIIMYMDRQSDPPDEHI